MGWFKKILGLEKEKPIIKEEEKQPETNALPNAAAQIERRNISDLCALCNQPIGTDRWKRVGPNYMHKKCFKKKQKDMLNGR